MISEWLEKYTLHIKGFDWHRRYVHYYEYIIYHLISQSVSSDITFCVQKQLMISAKHFYTMFKGKEKQQLYHDMCFYICVSVFPAFRKISNR